MVSPGPRPWPVTLLGLNLTVAAASVVLSLGREPGYDTAVYGLNAAALGLAGFLIVAYRPAHPIGWLFTTIGLQAGLVELAEGYGYHRSWPAAGPATWTATWGSFLGIGATVILPSIFPDGHALSPRWRPVVWAGAAGTVLTVAGAATGHALDVRFAGGANPYAIEGPLPGAVFVAGQCLLLVALFGSIASLAVRFRRAGAEARLQLKWLMYVLGLLLFVGPPAIFFYDRSVLVQWLIGVTVILIPVAVGIAVVRHRLYDIDVIISRTLVYASLSAVLAGSWLATAWLAGTLIGRQRSGWVTAAATVVACAAFLPVRRRLQDLIDRRFRRARHDALSQVDAYLEDLRTGRAAPEALETVLREVLGEPGLRVRYVLPGEPVPETEGTTRTTIRRAGAVLAVVEHPAPAPPLLGDVLERAGLAIEIARLRTEVAHQLEEVSRSRERIVAAGHEERRRLERDLHDGAQQRLIVVGLALRHAQHRISDPSVGADLEEAVGQVAAAIGELREIARGVRPSGLDDGLAVALRELVGRTPIPVHLELSPERCPAEVEATAYFVASEALANAVKHARAGALELLTERRDDDLVLRISDDGVGGADPAGGSGLRGLDDRVAAHGGVLRLTSPAGGGTTLVARLPCGS